MARDEPIGSSIWSIDISSSGDRVIVGSGYPEMSIAMLHGKGHKEFQFPCGGVPGILKLSKARGNIIAGLVARRGIGIIMNLNHRGKTLWQLNTQKKIETVDSSNDGELIIIGTKDGTILCLDKNGKDLWHKRVGVYKGPLNVFFYKDKVFTITSKGNVYVFNRIGHLLWDHPLVVFVNKLAVSQAGHMCLSVHSSKTIYYYDDQGKLLFAKDVGDKITALDVSPSGKFVLVGTIHGNVYMFNDNGKPIFSHMLSNRVNCLAISNNEKYFSVGTNDFHAFLFNTKGDLYWTYRTGIEDQDEFFSEFPAGCVPIDKSAVLENMEAPVEKESIVLLDGIKKVIRRLDTGALERELDEDKKPKSASKKVLEADIEFAEEVTPSSREDVKKFKPREERKGIVIKSWTNFKDLKQPSYLVLIKNFTQNPLEAVEIVPKCSSHTFRIMPDFKDFDSIPPSKKLLIKFRLEPVANYRQFEDTQIFSEINYIDNFTNKMISINTNKLLVPFTIPQISFKDQELPDDKDWEDFESIQAKQEFDMSQSEARSALKEFLNGHNITFKEKEEEDGYLIIGKDYRGGMLYIDMSLEDLEEKARITADIRYQNQKSLPPLYYFLVNRLNEILGGEEEFLEEEEMEWLDEEDDVEWVEEEEGDDILGPRGMQEEDTLEPEAWEEGDAVSVVNIRHIIEKHGVDKELQYRGFYLIDYEDKTRMFDLINNNANQLEKCILLTREYPKKIREIHIYDPELLDIRWISTLGEEGAYSPSELEKISSDIKKELDDNHHSLVMIDSFEYLLNNNDYSSVYNFVSELKDIVSLHESILVVNLDFGSLSKTQFNQLKKEADSAWEM
jgi:outer membrane protein assembly factor BamB